MHFLSRRLSRPTEWSLATEQTQCCTRVCTGGKHSRAWAWARGGAGAWGGGWGRWSYAAVFRRDDKLGDLSSVDAENVLHLAGENVPDDDGEVHASGHQGALVVARGHQVGVEDAGHLVPVAPQGPVGRPACAAERQQSRVASVSSLAPPTPSPRR